MPRRRIELALNQEFSERGHQIGPAERAALRAQARALDEAEGLADPDVISRANAVYLDLRQAAGLVAGPPPPSDTFAELLAELARPKPGVRDQAD